MHFSVLVSVSELHSLLPISRNSSIVSCTVNDSNSEEKSTVWSDIEGSIPVFWPCLEEFDVYRKHLGWLSPVSAALWWFRLFPEQQTEPVIKCSHSILSHGILKRPEGEKKCSFPRHGRGYSLPLTVWWLRWPVCCLSCPRPLSRLQATVPGRPWCSSAAF